jgi:hypothetical protein
MGEGHGTRALALLITIILTAWWTFLAWSDLAALRLPDADDMLRLARIRDWLDGQAFADPIQGRLGPLGGIALHWSRLPDLIPAALIWLLSPLMGVTRAEIAAVIFWPELLLFVHLLLTGAIARRLGGASAVPAALAIAALAYPAIDLFLPGRIDHHGLQIVLVEAMLLFLLSGRLLLAGLAAGTSLVVGVETAPVIAAAMLWLAVTWVRTRKPVAGFGIGLLIAALTAFILLRPTIWPADRCDGFTPPLFAMLLMSGGYWLVLGGLAPRLVDAKWRIVVVASMATLVLAAGWLAAPACFASPYGAADPLLARVWPEQVGELGGVLFQDAGTLVAWFGLAVTGLIAALWLLRRETEQHSGIALLAAAIAISLLAALLQIRGAWIGAALAAPILAQLIRTVRTRGAVWQIGAWLISIGLLWQAVGEVGLRARQTTQPACSDRYTLAALDRLDTGSFAAPLELSAYLIGATQHRALGGPYHRDQMGNRALAEFFRASPEAARYQASLWGIDYVALCPSATGGLPAELRRPEGLGGHLLGGGEPAWLDPVPLVGSDLLVWRVQRVAAPGLRP